MGRRTSARYLITALAVVLAVSFAVHSVQSQEEAAEKEKSLYERLGGVYAIATVVDDFIERLLVNDVLNANPAIAKAREEVPKAGLKFHVTAMVCQVSGGPQVYTGRSMKEAHSHLNINEEQWGAMVKDFVDCLNHFKVPEKEQQELLALIGPTKADIVTAK